MRLEDGVAAFEMIEHHASEETARRRVEEYLRAWEIDTALRFGREEVRFEFEGADVIDCDPPPPGTSQVVYAKALMGAVGLMGNVTAHVTRGRYPEPPTAFFVSPDVETVWYHYQAYLEGREPLVDMANRCLSLLDERGGTRRGAAKKYGIEYDVLHELGRLTSTVGDYRSARKLKGITDPRPHTGAEEAWMEAAVKVLIRRLGEWAYDPGASLPQITMSDLPKL